jgi:hypothetical protein
MINRRTYQNAAALGIAGFAFFLTTSGAFAFSASFAWCSGSPSFALTEVPQGTARVQFAVTDLNVPSFHHGGGTVAYSGQTAVPCGAFSSGFTGASPPPGQVHTLISSASRRSGQTAQCWQRPRRGASFRSDNRARSEMTCGYPLVKRTG